MRSPREIHSQIVKARYIIQQWLDDTKRTKAAFAAELGMQSSALSMMLSGQRRMSLAVAIKAAEISQLPIETFYRLWTDVRSEEKVA
jgi:antitoxin component HigA of HigAB toxin-antitoxin module